MSSMLTGGVPGTGSLIQDSAILAAFVGAALALLTNASVRAYSGWQRRRQLQTGFIAELSAASKSISDIDETIEEGIPAVSYIPRTFYEQNVSSVQTLSREEVEAIITYYARAHELNLLIKAGRRELESFTGDAKTARAKGRELEFSEAVEDTKRAHCEAIDALERNLSWFDHSTAIHVDEA